MFLLLAICVSVTAIFAWFLDLSRSRVGGLTLNVVSDNVTYGALTLERKSPLAAEAVQTTYTPDKDGIYRTDDGERLYLSGLADGEEIAFTVRFTLDEGYGRYSVALTAMSGDALENTTHTVLGAVQYLSADGWVWLENDDGTRPGSLELVPTTAAGASTAEVTLKFRINFARITDKSNVKGKCFTLGTFKIVGEKL